VAKETGSFPGMTLNQWLKMKAMYDLMLTYLQVFLGGKMLIALFDRPTKLYNTK